MSWACDWALHDGGDDWVGVLRLVEEYVVGGQPRARQLPELQVHVMVESQLPVCAGEVIPCRRRERRQRLAEHGQAFRGVETGFARHVVPGRRPVGGAAEPLDGFHHQARGLLRCEDRVTR